MFSPMLSLCFCTLPLLNGIVAQTTTYSNLAAVPTGTPIPGDYTGALRPQVHFSPPAQFMNDPNGMFLDSTGTYHLYYQYNPISTVAGNQSWGHATSKNLYHWTNQPIAIHPINASSYIFSGSAVVDTNNTSGFFPNQTNGVVAIFTIATYEPILLQTQGIAIFHDGGYSFSFYSGNPVVDIGSSQFRDPKVLWHPQTKQWVMVLAYASEYTIGFFTSPNLKNWTHASNFTAQGWLGVQWECPNLVQTPLENPLSTDASSYWLLQVSINPGSPLGGSISQYFPGSFNGTHFLPLDHVTRFTDFGKDNYAGQFFYAIPAGEAPIQMAWASNWEYSQVVPTGEREGWRSAMTLPRRQTLRRTANGLDLALVSMPVDMGSVMGAQLLDKNLGNGSAALDFSSVASNALYFNASASVGVTAGTVNVTFSSPVSGEYLQAGLFLGTAQPIFVTRRGVRGFDNVLFTDSFSTHTVDGLTSVAGVIDRSIFEVYGNGGEVVATTSFFPNEPLTVMSVAVAGLMPGNASVNVQVNGLQSGWTAQENEQGIVLGNVTASGSGSQKHKRVVYEADFEH